MTQLQMLRGALRTVTAPCRRWDHPFETNCCVLLLLVVSSEWNRNVLTSHAWLYCSLSTRYCLQQPGTMCRMII